MIENIEQCYIEKYYREYKCNYQYEEVTYDWNIIGKRDLYKCPECIYQGSKENKTMKAVFISILKEF